jgi:DNA-binding beta-propeller fold protein YncE
VLVRIQIEVNFARITTRLHRLSLILVLPFLLAAATSPALRQVAMLDLPARPGFEGSALARGMLLLSHGVAGTVDLFDTQKRRIVGHVRNMSSPRGIVYDDVAHLAYVANAGAANIVVISTVNWQVQRTIPVEGSPQELLLLPAEHLLFVTFPEKQAVAALNLASSGLPVTQTVIEGHPRALAWDDKRHQLCVSVQDRRCVLVMTPSLQLLRRIELNASEPTGLAFSARHDRLYVAVRYAVLALDPDSGLEVSRTAVVGGIDRIVFDEATASLIGAADGSVVVLPAAATLGAADELQVDVKGHSIAYDTATGTIYLPGGREGRSKLLILRRIPAQSR